MLILPMIMVYYFINYVTPFLVIKYIFRIIRTLILHILIIVLVGIIFEIKDHN